ncbi:hypothetical protein Moror_9379, partial [Moniliophthora roreri MCA 2997]
MGLVLGFHIIKDAKHEATQLMTRQRIHSLARFPSTLQCIKDRSTIRKENFIQRCSRRLHQHIRGSDAALFITQSSYKFECETKTAKDTFLLPQLTSGRDPVPGTDEITSARKTSTYPPSVVGCTVMTPPKFWGAGDLALQQPCAATVHFVTASAWLLAFNSHLVKLSHPSCTSTPALRFYFFILIGQ